MYIINDEIYKMVASLLLEELGDGDYYSGAVELEREEFSLRFICSLFIYRRTDSLPEGDVRRINDLVPVWWEVHLITDEGEVISDFDFMELKRQMLIC